MMTRKFVSDFFFTLFKKRFFRVFFKRIFLQKLLQCPKIFCKILLHLVIAIIEVNLRQRDLFFPQP